jgi:hypothetical protein
MITIKPISGKPMPKTFINISFLRNKKRKDPRETRIWIAMLIIHSQSGNGKD